MGESMSFYAHIIIKRCNFKKNLKKLKIQLCFYSRFLKFLLPNRISVLVMPNDYPVYF